MLSTSNKLKLQKGISLFETLLAISIISIAVAYMTQRYFLNRQIIIDRAMGQYMDTAAQGVQEYINAYQQQIISGSIPTTDGTCANNICTLNLSSTSNLNNYFPTNFLNTTPWFKNTTEGNITVKVQVSGTVPYYIIQGYVFAVPTTPIYTDSTTQNTHLSAAVSKGGLDVGAVYAGSTDVVGNNGTWTTNLVALYGGTLPVTTLVARTGDGLPQEQNFLRLDGTNSMIASLNMGGTNTTASDMTNIGNIASTGITNAPVVQFSGFNVTGNVDLGAGGNSSVGLNFVQSGSNTALGGIWADSNSGGTAFLGPNFILGSKVVNAMSSTGATPTSATWYLPSTYTDSVAKLNVPAWNQWGEISMDMTGFGTATTNTANLGVVRTQNLTFTSNSANTSKMDITGANPTYLGSGNNGVTTVSNLLQVYSGITNVSNEFVSEKQISSDAVSVDEINSSTWGTTPVDVTMTGGWNFSQESYTKNVQFTPENIAEGGNCSSFVGSGGTAIASNGIGAILYCKNNTWVTGWY
jgi:type II secretory pathway pseudopilin PulG